MHVSRCAGKPVYQCVHSIRAVSIAPSSAEPRVMPHVAHAVLGEGMGDG